MSYAQAIVKHLGGEWFESRGFGLAPAPGHSKKDRSLKVSVHRSDHDDVVAHSFAGDDVLELKRAWREEGLLPRGGKSGFSKTRNPAEAAIQQKRSETERAQDVARWLWNKSQPADAIVKTYLRSRGIELAPWPQTIRFLPASPPKHPYPAMIAPYGLPDEPEPGVYVMPPDRVQGVHLTYLKHDGSGKAPVEPDEGSLAGPEAHPSHSSRPMMALASSLERGSKQRYPAHSRWQLAHGQPDRRHSCRSLQTPFPPSSNA